MHAHTNTSSPQAHLQGSTSTSSNTCPQPCFAWRVHTSSNIYISMPVSGMARQGLVVGGAAAAAWLTSGTSLALADDKKKEKDGAASYFDPDALERGAKALREINASPHAKQASQPWSTVLNLSPQHQPDCQLQPWCVDSQAAYRKTHYNTCHLTHLA